ncbi:oligomeric complex COG6-domain-containing protein [Podospora didyma]|uniref:Conserved oligomeric Golgi complex subunit 6 n=1 Tax=Podospora didyma TaxID=330526 RepID=A0AAE0NNH5_9PEZI|nr:oligomeric complex COG6-domain-containing protein [Podospora didyma]
MTSHDLVMDSPAPGPLSPPLSKGANPLSSKVTSVLSTSYADTEFREALALLDDRNVYNTSEARRRLRLDLQKEVIDSNGEVINEFAKVAEQLRRIGNTVGRLNDSFTEMKTQIGAAHAETSSALEEASVLISQRSQVEQTQALLKAFNANFVLSDDDLVALTQTSEPVDDKFFIVLSKAKKINKDCEVLLGFENQTLGLEIMEQASKNLNQGFQKVYKWVQREFKTLNLENPQIGSSIRRALRVLAERPNLFQNCLDFFAEAREHVLSDSFHTALTGSHGSRSHSSSVKPIELAAHDPLRYVGDMLAWAHSAAVGEREALEVLFISDGNEIAKGIQAGRESEMWRLIAEDGEGAIDFDPVSALNELVDRDMSGAVRLLRQRVEQVIQANEDTILAYKLANLLSFYKSTFSKLLSPDSSLVESLTALEAEALRQFRSLARDHVSTLQGEFRNTPGDLRPPEFLLNAMEQLSAIMKTYETSFTSSGDREADFEPVLAESFDPFMSGCAKMAQVVSPPSDSIFLINCFLTALDTLSRFDFTQRRAAQLQEKVIEEKTRLVESQYVFFRMESGLDSLIGALGALREESIADAPALTQASHMLDDFLPSALMDAVQNLKQLQDSKLAMDITEEATERLCVDFEHVEEMLTLADEMAERLSDADDAPACIMLRNRTAAPVLQKTYDESYLTCSTAVYYESQGNEDEAMRCWKLALDQIYDHHANKVLPNYTPRSETERALVDSLRQLELQCKERIDLLEALRLSRQEASPNSSSSKEQPIKSSPPDPLDTGQHDKGWIGGRTIPAVTYAQLSRPGLLQRPSMPTRSSSEQAVIGDRWPQPEEMGPPSPGPLVNPPPPLPSPEGKTSRQPSPERHTMRTTLRTSRLGDRTSKTSSRRTVQKPAEKPGASKAASLAWNALGLRERPDLTPSSSSQSLSRAPSSPPTPSEQPSKSLEMLHKQWDSHSRRLVPPLNRSPAVKSPEERSSPTPTTLRHSDEYSYLRPSPLSISAASNALSSMALRGSPDRTISEADLVIRQKTAPPQTPRVRSSRREEADIIYSANRSAKTLGRKTSSDPVIISRKPVFSPAVSTSNGRPGLGRSGRGAETGQSESRRRESRAGQPMSSSSDDSSSETRPKLERRKKRAPERGASFVANSPIPSPESSAEDEEKRAASSWKRRKTAILKNLPPGVDEHAAKQILNEIVVRGDEVHWSDIAGLEIAKNALRETVVYPFLRPDLFMGLREPARGMLLFGPPGTGKTMLARAVATESKSTFFSISASSLTSKYLGESEKLVRALFCLAKVLAPSIIFVDEIDSLLSQRSGSGEHEATRRIKTEFLIQWSDLQRAAVGRDSAERDRERDDANRVLVLAATNLPWAIDEAARRRFVRRQYIPLPESETRAVQLKTLLKQQNHTLTDADIDVLVGMTDGFSGSDITALAKDAAMGPLRSLGEALLHMTMDQIRPIELSDFVASLVTIRPSVSKTGLKEYEDWAQEYGERGG